MKNNTANRKATKAQIREAIDSFGYRYDWLTGGTREEVARQAEAGMVTLNEMAKAVFDLMENPNKAAATCDRIADDLGRIKRKLETYGEILKRAQAEKEIVETATEKEIAPGIIRNDLENITTYCATIRGAKTTICFFHRSGAIMVQVQNASNRAWRGAGKTFHSIRDIRNHYTSAAMLAFITVVAEDHQANAEQPENVIPFAS